MLRIVMNSGADFPIGWETHYEVNTIPLSIQSGNRIYIQGQGNRPWNFYQLVQENREIPMSRVGIDRSFYYRGGQSWAGSGRYHNLSSGLGYPLD